jgi:putative sterol carrier protein
MNPTFPSQAWVEALVQILNGDERYSQVAHKWEGDLLFVVRPDRSGGGGGNEDQSHVYLDLWHGKCRAGRYLPPHAGDLPKPAFTMTADLGQFRQILKGELDPMQAMLTRRLLVAGNMAYILRNVPVVLDFVRCCRLAGVPE